MRWPKVITLVATILIVVLAAGILFPVYADHAVLGLDLQGGVMVRLEAPEGTSMEEMEAAKSVIENRINGLGVAEPEVRLEGTNRISVELPGVEDADEAVRVIGTTAKLQFIRYDNGEIILEGSDLKHASAGVNEQALYAEDKFLVSLEFNSEGTKKFANATNDLINTYGKGDEARADRIIAIVLDGQIISAPSVNEPIIDGKAQISGGFMTYDEVSSLATMLRGGALPVDLTIVEKQITGPQLGADSIAKSITAAIIGVIALAVFMIVMYRVPGIVAVFALLLYAIIVIGANVAIKATITLPVIAAFLLSVGMAVDANVIIFERIKEEMRAGKTLRVAVDSGFKKAFSTIFDSNITTLLAAVILIAFGTGSVRGFAVTLTIGILASMFTAITFTRFMLVNLVSSNLIRNNKFYGA
ncbi:MAG: protein translocase subunit SecD [Peptococcaceae bacterium]|nr:protein translocase subunit SecD [Peptococcaceae bacterium]MBO5300777.1 protein translocase subunit SecD [Peptococcaceae bacterium]MBO5429524.1 protein translocase subunit SecD [Peptococcaceae bacterium]MBP3585253.1 protein translocase subunit SecD [Peptococcaceae bacterium]